MAIRLVTLLTMMLTSVLACASARGADNRADAAAPTTRPVTFTGGHDIGRNDHGRPCALIAAALGVETDVFRQAFSGVTPAKGGGPSPDEARKNKAALMKVLAPHGVTNERMDEVANYYRYRPQAGELWPTTAAKGYAVVEAGKVKRVVVTEPGSGYNSPPAVLVEGIREAALTATLGFSKDLKANGTIASVEVLPTPAR